MTRSDARKPECDTLPFISVDYMNREGLIKHNVRSVISTSWGYSRTAKVSVDTSLQEMPLIMLSFRLFNEDIHQKVYLTNTVCYFGGIRWWFKCPDCYKRIGKLFLLNRHYACRHCHDLTYKSRMRSPRSPPMAYINRIKKNEKASELLAGMRTTSYNGKPTKRYLKIIELTGYGNEY